MPNPGGILCRYQFWHMFVCEVATVLYGSIVCLTATFGIRGQFSNVNSQNFVEVE